MKIKSIYPIVVLASLLLVAVSCNDDYDEHYDEDKSITSEFTLMELIDKESDLSTFASMLRKVQYDLVLSSDQTFTVWAPTNNALTDIDMNNEEEVRRAVTNHVARFSYSASGSGNNIVYMLNKKLIPFGKNANGYQFGDAELAEPNTTAKNGILHVLNGKVPFQENVWEYMMLPQYTSVGDYLYSFNTKVFSQSQSILIDYNEEGLAIYDSVFIESNPMWETRYMNSRGIGFLSDEDSIYTMIIPTNEAWEEAYKRIAPYFVSNDLIDPDSVQEANTKYAIIQDLVFRGEINPESMGAADSLISTRHSVFHNPKYLFEGATKEEVSNGWIYRTDRLRHNYWESWNQTIKLEAEWSNYRQDPLEKDGTVYTRRDLNNKEISNYGYIEVNPAAAGSRPEVIFEIPNTLSAAYNIYCVFVPDAITNPSNPRKTRARFDVQQLNRQTQRWGSMASGGGPGKGVVEPATGNLISATEMTKLLLVENFVFPYANVNEEINTIRIIVRCHVPAGETSQGFANRMKIDCLLLEPVH